MEKFIKPAPNIPEKEENVNEVKCHEGNLQVSKQVATVFSSMGGFVTNFADLIKKVVCRAFSEKTFVFAHFFSFSCR